MYNVQTIVRLTDGKKGSEQASLQEMMLDSEADSLTAEEGLEVLSILPDYTDKNVIEIGAGNG